MISTTKIKELLIEKGVYPVIIGPTASGKTSVSLLLAELLDSEIISADSRQMFRLMDIGTAKPTKDELAKVKHHFIDCLDLTEKYSSGKFGDDAEITLNEIFKKNKIPIVVGGSGLYIKSLCEGLFDEEEFDAKESIRLALQEKLNREGIDSLYNDLIKIDKDSAEKYPDKNPRRIIRALEFYLATGELFSSVHMNRKKDRSFKPVYFGLYVDREKLYGNINRRTQLMWDMGLPEEAQKILSLGYSQELNSLNTVGYKETFAFLNGDLNSQNAIELIQKNTRHYAKRQMTWFKKVQNVNWINFDTAGQYITKIVEKLDREIISEK